MTTSSSFGGVVTSGSGNYVPPTPPTRKRVTRKNSGPLLNQSRSSRSFNLPIATGPDPDAVRWTNEMLFWLHTDLVVLDELLAVWVNSLNDFVASSVSEVSFFIFSRYLIYPVEFLRACLCFFFLESNVYYTFVIQYRSKKR